MLGRGRERGVAAEAQVHTKGYPGLALGLQPSTLALCRGQVVPAGETGPVCPGSCCRLLPQCITNAARERKIHSSLQLPDRVLNFLKDHFLMDGQVRSQMLLLQPHARYQRVAVHRLSALGRTYDVLFLGTGECL